MGTDNLFHKRKAKNAKALQRKRNQRAPYDRVLIVCEGEKTEPNYFNELREYYRLSTVNIEVRGDCGSDPMSVFRFAKQRFREEKDNNNPFDKVFCIFDKDAHANYDEAVQAINSTTPANTFYAITSVPAFEFWLLLHFIFSTKPYRCLPNNSAAKQLERELKNYLPHYQKGEKGVFKKLIQSLPFALSNAKKLARQANHSGNPSTQVHSLVETLQNIKKR